MQSFIFDANETPEQAALRKKRAVAQALAGPQQMPQSLGEGLSALGDAFVMRKQMQDAAFPNAPGGERPSFFTAMRNMFSGGHNGGLY
jgi:hypothetical protein